MRVFVAVALLVLPIFGQAPKLKPPPEKAAFGFNDINEADCKTYLEFLANECEGRGTGQAGYKKAADYVAAKFKEWGLEAVGDKDDAGAPTYFQMVPYASEGVDKNALKAEIVGAQATFPLVLGEGFGVDGSGEIKAKEAPIVVIAADADLKELPAFDVARSVVLVAAYDKSGNPSARPRWFPKFLDLKPLAVLRVDEVKAAAGAFEGDWTFAPDGSEKKDESRAPRRRRPSIPGLYVSKAVAEKIAEAGGVDFQRTIDQARKSGAPARVKTTAKATIEVSSARRVQGVPNVVGYLEGSDPKLKEEMVIFGSHLDHLGRNAAGEVFPGADDDGSGSTALLALARAYAKSPTRPKRSLLFLAFCGEEKGLDGSGWYVKYPIFPLKNAVAEIQMDMIGRWEEAHPFENPGDEKAEDNKNTLHVVGSKKISTVLHDVVMKTNEDYLGFEFEFDGEKYYRRSDHYNFAKNGVPIAFFFTGVHRDYHRTTDTPDKIDYAKLARVARLVYLIGWELGDRKERPPTDVKQSGGRSRDD
jgi:hypothetical protein